MTTTRDATSRPLVSTQWLADHLGGDDLVVLDASVAAYRQPDGRPGFLSGHEEYILVGHIPGAVFADVIESLSDPDGAFPFTRPSPERFAAEIGALGVGGETTVVVYDSAVGQWAARVRWLLRSFGHERVVVLDGGLTKWRAEGRVLETGHVAPVARTFEPVPQPGFWADKADLERVLAGEDDAVLVCATPPREFTGEESSRARAGHIPGSVSVPAGRLVDRQSNAVLRDDALRTALGDVADAPKVIAYCGGGIAATAAALAIEIAGGGPVAVYDGSLNEWAADADAPLVVMA